MFKLRMLFMMRFCCWCYSFFIELVIDSIIIFFFSHFLVILYIAHATIQWVAQSSILYNDLVKYELLPLQRQMIMAEDRKVGIYAS